MKIFVIRGLKDGSHSTLLVTPNIEKAKAFIITDGWDIEVWENDEHLQTISYDEEMGFLVMEIQLEDGDKG